MTASPARKRFGSLEAIEFPAPEGAPAIVVLHGYGADMTDLAPIAGMTLPAPVRWIFLNGPLPVPEYGGRCWFPIPAERFERIEREGRPVSLAAERPAGMEESVGLLARAIQDVAAPWDRLILGGFSQGAMMSLEASLEAPAKPLGLFLLSGTLVDEPRLIERAPKRAGLAFFQSHGRHDPLLAFSDSRRLRELLSAAGWRPDWVEFDGGHMLPPEALAGLERYLAAAVRLCS